jgi:hypothetical protein
MLVLTKAIPADKAETKLDFDFDGEYKKWLKREEAMKPLLNEVNENIRVALAIKEGKE